MNQRFFALVLLLPVAGCSPTAKDNTVDPNLELGNQFVDAFYSFNRDSLQSLLTAAPWSQPEILYYQQWAKCAHYQVLNRSLYFARNDSIVVFPVTVKDDLMDALQIKFNVTDTFHIVVLDGEIRSVTTSSNDPSKYYEAKEWVKANRPELVEEPCEGIWEGGPTPCDCVLGMIEGFKALMRAAP